MRKAVIPSNEQQRIESLRSLNILDTPQEERFDRITRHISHLLNMPIALVSLIDVNRQWFKSCIGLDTNETSREISFCGHAILSSDIFVIEDALLDERFVNNPLVTGRESLRFYAGCPIRHSNGHILGTLCILDYEPRKLNQHELTLLKEAALLVELELAQESSDEIDSETGLSNLKGFYTISQQTQKICQYHKLDICMVFLFVKGLMSLQYNGHEKEYQTCLSIITHEFKQLFRSSDVLARYDGSSFVALLINQYKEEQRLRIEQLVNNINRKLMEVTLTTPLSIVVGVTTGNYDTEIDQLLFDSYSDLHQ